MRNPIRGLSIRSTAVRSAAVIAAATATLAVATPAIAASSAAHYPPVLGARSYHPAAHGGEGWGYAHPATIFNGGDPGGLATDITWTGWGGAQSYGVGKIDVQAPGGGYYPQKATIDLRAHVLYRCSAGGVLAYTELQIRVPAKPGGPLGPWVNWGTTASICKGT